MKKTAKPPHYLHVRKLIKIYLWLLTMAFVFALLGFLRLALQAQQQPLGDSSTSNQKVERGTIYDRNGRILALQVRRHSLEAWPKLLENTDVLAEELAKILNLPYDKLKKQLSSNRNYLWVKRFLSDSETEKVRLLLDKQHTRGMRLVPESSRIYPNQHLASHLIGFTNIDGVGLDGVEMTMDAWLGSANYQEQQYEVGYGNDVYLSIDIETQYLIDKIARKSLAKQQADNLIILLMDARNGDLLSYAALPEYDPSRFSKYDESIRRNITVANVYEPGSVFKIFPMAIFLDAGLTQPDEILNIGTVYSPDSFDRYNISPITDITEHGALSLTEVLIYSSNVGMATLAERISPEQLYQRITDFGFGKVTGVPLPGESNGLLKEPEFWSLRTKPTIVFGQEIAVTAMQIIAAATALANGGVLLEPQIIKKVVRNNGTEAFRGNRGPIKEVISPATARNILLMMEQVVASPFGTMRDAQIDGLRISGKSGTAQVFDPRTGRYDPDKVNSSILVIFPTDEPQFIIYISMLNPKGKIRYGGRIASPVAKEIILAIANRYNLALAGNKIARHDGKISSVSLRPPRYLNIKENLPSLLGFSKKELLPVIQDPRIQVAIEGNGRVVFQKPDPGTIIPATGLQLRLLLQ